MSGLDAIRRGSSEQALRDDLSPSCYLLHADAIYCSTGKKLPTDSTGAGFLPFVIGGIGLFQTVRKFWGYL